MKFSVGDRVSFRRAWDIFPHTIVKAGETGVVEGVSGSITIKLDAHHPGLGEWGNRVFISSDPNEDVYVGDGWKVTDYLGRAESLEMWLVVERERGTGDNCDACCGVSLVANHGVFDSEACAIAWAEANLIVEKGWRWYFVEKVEFNPGDAPC